MDDAEVVRRAFSGWDAGPAGVGSQPLEVLIEEAFDAHFHPDVEYREDPDWPGSRTYTGREAVKRCFRAYAEVMGFSDSYVEQVVPAGDEIVAVVRVGVLPQDTTVPVEHRWGYVCRVRDGKVSFFQAFVEPDEAFRAAGVDAFG